MTEEEILALDVIGLTPETYEREGRKYTRQGECSRCGKCCWGISVFLSRQDHPQLIPRLAALIERNSDGSLGKAPLMIKNFAEKPCQYPIVEDGKTTCSIYDHRPYLCSQMPSCLSDWTLGCSFNLIKKEN